MQVTTIGLDLAKNVFQVHGVDAAGKVIFQRQLRRGRVIEFFKKLPHCLVGMEACATGHHWARELTKLGHTVRLMPASYVKAYVRRQKNDAADAAAICEAVTRPSMRFVPVKSAEQQAALMLHRSRDLLVRQRTQLINALRAHLAEIGLVAATGVDGLMSLLAIGHGGSPVAAAGIPAPRYRPERPLQRHLQWRSSARRHLHKRRTHQSPPRALVSASPRTHCEAGRMAIT
jgi:transposase